MTIDLSKLPRVVLYGIVAVGIAIQTCTLFYVHNHPDSAADAIMARSPAGYALLLVLKVYKVDDEADLTSADLSRDAIADACRFRADYGMRWSAFWAAFLVVFFVVHSAFNRSS